MSQSTVTVTVAPLEAVRLTAPVDGATYPPGTILTLKAEAPAGSVLEFLCNGTVVGFRVTAPYTLPVKLSAGVKVFSVRLKATVVIPPVVIPPVVVPPVIVPPVVVPPVATGASPDDTQGLTITDALGGVWTFGSGGETLRAGAHMGGGFAAEYLWWHGTVYVITSADAWYQWTGSGWTALPLTEASMRPFSRGRKGVAQPPPEVGSNLNTALRANSYDNAWQSAWIGNANSVLNEASGKTLGKVLHVGDSNTLTQAYGYWGYYTENPAGGYTAADVATLAWMRIYPYASNSGWYLSASAITAKDSPSLGWGDARIDVMLADPEVNDAQFAVVMMNYTPNIATVQTDLQKFLDAGIVPILSTNPPRDVVGYDATYTIPFNALLRTLADTMDIPLIDLYEEILLRRPNGTWANTLIDSDGVHLSGGGSGYGPTSNPYTPGGNSTTFTTGDACLWSGCLLRTWLTVQKVTELRTSLSFDVGSAMAILASKPLVQKETWVYLGQFHAPEWNPSVDGGSAGYGGSGLTYNPANNSLFITDDGNNYSLGTPRVAEMSIPATLSQTYHAGMPYAVYLQPYNADMWDGTMYGDEMGDIHIHNGRLIMTSRIGYDANWSQNQAKTTHAYRPSLDLSLTGITVGPQKLSSAKANYVSGYMNPIPDYAQAALGGTALTGWSCGPSIIGRTSTGPAVAAFDPDLLGTVNPVPSTDLIWYDGETPGSGHPTLGRWSTLGNVWPRQAGVGEDHRYNGSVVISGVCMPNNSRSVLFFGRIGYGSFCYGHSTGLTDRANTDCNPNGTAWNGGLTNHDHTDDFVNNPGTGDAQHYCVYFPSTAQGNLFEESSGLSYYSVTVDPADGLNVNGAGVPTIAQYHYQVWAYDALDLAQVKAGTLQPWEVVPYAYWTLDDAPSPFYEGHIGFTGANKGYFAVNTKGCAYDSVNNKLYMFQNIGDMSGGPTIHVFQHVPV